MKKIIVVGGGAAGCMAAYTAAKAGASVILLEKNEKIGKKIYITGKGRCNVTNACDVEELFLKVCSNPKFLFSSFYGFTNQDTMDFFESFGVPLKVERGNRVFPVSDHSSDILLALKNALRSVAVNVRYHAKVKSLITEESEETGKIKANVKGVVLEDGTKLFADAVILATGGLSYASTGSDGDGHRFLEKLDLKMTPCTPALVPFNIREEWVKELQGLSLKNVKLTLSDGKKTIHEEQGEMLFTHFGISGPLVLTAGSRISPKKHPFPLYIRLDLKPALSPDQLDKRLLREFEENNKKLFRNSLGNLFPSKLIPIMILLSGIDPETPVYMITREQRLAFVELIKNMQMTLTSFRGFNEAIITKGGLSVKELDPSTMRVKTVDGLYAAGELLDLDAETGGYNLQIAWSTGYLAGQDAAQED